MQRKNTKEGMSVDDKIRKVFAEITNLSEEEFERYCDIINRKRGNKEIEELLHNYKSRLEKLRR